MRVLHAGFERVPAVPGADLRYAAEFLPAPRADAVMAVLLAELPWQAHRLSLFGREVDAPRLSCWIGDAGTAYTYSRSRFEPRPWTATLAALREEIEERLGLGFNSVLANLYRDGRDSMGWHSDDEPELGADPAISSLSLGVPRTFCLRPREACAGDDVAAARIALELAHGSLLLMAGATQRLYRHALPRRARVTQPRINLTFRQIAAAGKPAPR